MMNLNKLATWGLWDEAGSGMNDLECYSSKYAQLRKADVVQQTKRAVLYFVWEGAQTPCPEHLEGWPGLCSWHTGYVYIMNWLSTNLAMICDGSRNLCSYCALATKALPAAGPKRAVCMWGAKARGLCVGTEQAAHVYRFCIFHSSSEQISCSVKGISEPSSADMRQASTVTIPSCTINQ